MDYKYKAFVTKVYDGDTITVNIDLGFGIKIFKQKIRLYGINTPEIRGECKEDGYKSRDYLSNLILNKEIILETYKDKTCKYGRWLGIIHFEGVNLNEDLVEKELAVVNFY
jgi:micrococcal nuclease